MAAPTDTTPNAPIARGTLAGAVGCVGLAVVAAAAVLALACRMSGRLSPPVLADVAYAGTVVAFVGLLACLVAVLTTPPPDDAERPRAR